MYNDNLLNSFVFSLELWIRTTLNQSTLDQIRITVSIYFISDIVSNRRKASAIIYYLYLYVLHVLQVEIRPTVVLFISHYNLKQFLTPIKIPHGFNNSHTFLCSFSFKKEALNLLSLDQHLFQQLGTPIHQTSNTHMRIHTHTYTRHTRTQTYTLTNIYTHTNALI